jgi:excisionase family DNA binding protein
MNTAKLKPVSVTIEEAKRLTGLGRTTLYALMAEGKLKTTTIGRRRLVLYSSIEKLVGETA